MDFDKRWTQFSLEAEIDHYGAMRIAQAHNKTLDKLATLENALKTISEYGKDGICPYGCDTPEIAEKALLAIKG